MNLGSGNGGEDDIVDGYRVYQISNYKIGAMRKEMLFKDQSSNGSFRLKSKSYLLYWRYVVRYILARCPAYRLIYK